MHRWLTTLCATALFVACTGDREAEYPETEAEHESSKLEGMPGGLHTFEDQVSLGGKLFGEHCKSCHGDQGQGTDEGPRVVGVAEGALPLHPPAGAKERTMQFRTAADVGDFVMKTMPKDKPGSLEEWQYWSILAFDLYANGISLPHKLDATTASQLVLHK